MRTSEQTTTLIAALVAARKAFAPIAKSAVGHVGKDGARAYQYADLTSILDAILPGLLANGLVILQTIDAETSSLTTRVVHVSGEWVESIYPLKIEPTAQAFGSALTYGRRYSISSLLCLAASDDDGAEAAAIAPPKKKAEKVATPKPVGVKTITEAQRKRLFVISSNAGWTHSQIKDYLARHVGIEHTTDIRADQYDSLCDVFGTPFEPEGVDVS